jgi:hypothetical protein
MLHNLERNEIGNKRTTILETTDDKMQERKPFPTSNMPSLTSACCSVMNSRPFRLRERIWEQIHQFKTFSMERLLPSKNLFSLALQNLVNTRSLRWNIQNARRGNALALCCHRIYAATEDGDPVSTKSVREPINMCLYNPYNYMLGSNRATIPHNYTCQEKN